MLGLQEVLEAQIKELAAPKAVLLRILNRRFEQLGMPLTSPQQESIAEQILATTDGTINIECENDQITAAGFSGPEEVEHLIHEVLDGIEGDIEEYVIDFEQHLPDTLQDAVKEIAPIILTSLKCRASELLVERRHERDSFRDSVAGTWCDALDLLETHLAIALEGGEYVSRVSRSAAAQSNDLVFDVLTRLHARACQISSEILTLLENGFADGAHARWRSLHEVTVVASFLRENGASLAERYLLHNSIESYDAALQYRHYSTRLNLEEMTDEEMHELSQVRDELIDRFGEDYKHEYGWAAEVIGKRRPTFADIEQMVDLDYLRPYYKLASYNVHANPKGVFAKLGILGSAEDLLLAGPSNIGLAEPGHLMALSLAHITICLLTHVPTMDTLVISRMLLDLVDEVGNAFGKAHDALMDNHKDA